MVTAPSDCSSSAQLSRRYEVLNVTPRSFQPLFGRRSSDERPRVLHVLEASLGGTGHYMADVLAAGIDAETGLVYSSKRADLAFGSFLERAARAGWKLYDVEMEREIRPLRDLRSAVGLRRVLAAFKPDIVHAHSSKAGALARIVGPTLVVRPAIVYSPHAIASNAHASYALIERMLATVTERFVAVSDSERAQLAAHGIASAGRIDVASPAIDGVHYAPRDARAAKRRCGLDGAPVVCAVGRLCHQKNPFEFLRIVRALRERYPALVAVWVGEGELRRSLEHALLETGDDEWFKLPGWHSDVRDWVAASDLVINSSSYESFGYVTIEALLMCRPVVASRIVGTTDIMMGSLSELLYENGDVAQAVALCTDVIERRSKYDGIVTAARASLLERFDVDSLRQRLSASYGSASAKIRSAVVATT
jgi:glycosyltransferase involved in cell wall biosynthesis